MNFWRFLSCRQTAIRLTHYAIEIDKETKHWFTFRCMSNGTSPQSEKNDDSKHGSNTPKLTSWLLLSLFHPYTSHISVILKSIHYRYIDNRPWKRLHLNSGHVPPHADESPVPRVCCSCIVIWFDIYFSDKIPINTFLRDIEMS